MTNLTRDFFDKYYRTYNSEDAEALKQFYADNLVLTSAQGVQHGVTAMIETYRYLIANFEDRMTPDSILIDGDRAAIEITDVFTARHAVADFMGTSLKAGEQLMLKLCALYQVRDSKITHATIYAR